jgi:hypothetical protein
MLYFSVTSPTVQKIKNEQKQCKYTDYFIGFDIKYKLVEKRVSVNAFPAGNFHANREAVKQPGIIFICLCVI